MTINSSRKIFSHFNKLSKCDKITILICALSFIGYSSLSLMTWDTWIPYGHYGNQYYFFAKHLAENQSLVYVNPLNEHYTPIFTANQFVQMGEKTLPSGFLGHIVFLAFFYFIHPKLVLLAVPFIAALGLFLFYRLTSLVFTKKIGVLSTGLLAVSPAYFYNSNHMFADVPAFVFLVGGLLYFFKMLKHPDRKINYILFPIFLALTVWLRYPNALLLLALIPIVYLVRRKVKLKYLLLSGCIFILFMSPLFILNSILYGGPFNLGAMSPYIVFAGLPVEKLPESMGLSATLFLPFKDWGLFADNIFLYFVRFSPLILLFSAFGIITYLRSDKNYLQQQFLIACSLISLILILYYSGGAFFGAKYPYPTVGASYVRYFIPIYAFLLIYTSVFLTRLSYKRILPVFLALFVLTGMTSSYFDNFQHERRGIQFLGTQYIPIAYLNSQEVIQNTEENAVVFCKFQDWIIYPNRNVAFYMLIPKEERVQEITKLISQLLSDRVPVYFLQEDWYGLGYKWDVYQKSFESEGLNISFVYEFMPWGGYYTGSTSTLWQITKGD